MVAPLKTSRFNNDGQIGVAVTLEVEGETFVCDVYEDGTLSDGVDGDGLLANDHATETQVREAARNS